MSHTKGKWEIKLYDNFDIQIKSGSKIICNIGSNSHDAKLISSAPEMLALLERITKLIDRDANGGQSYDSYVYASGIQNEIDRIIAKARGEK